MPTTAAFRCSKSCSSASAMGPTEALVRARASYYHQVGYYALGIRQTPEERAALMPMYFRVLTGFPMPADAGDPPTG